MAKKIQAGTYVLVGVAAVIVLMALWGFAAYNGFIVAEQGISAQYANVEAQYQRRADLIPNLISSVQGYMKYEKSLLTEITALRSQWQSASTPEAKIAAGSAMDGAIGRLIAVAENYPDLKADKTVTTLMDELAGTENRVAYERQKYNDAVKSYNLRVKMVPSSIIAGIFGFKEKSYFQSAPGSEQAPKVSF